MCEQHMSYMSGLSEEVKRKTAVICHGSGASEDAKGQDPIPHF